MYYDELYHHGIKGQKWGVRRFQKLDGTLTKLGKKISQEIRDRSQFNQLKKNFQTPREFTNDYRWNNHRHSPNAEMYKPGTDFIDPRHFKKDSLYNGPGVDHYKRDWNDTPLKSMSKYNQGNRVFQLIDERKAFNEAKNNWQQTPPSFKDDRNSSSFIARDNNGVPRNILPRETNETQVMANARMGRIMPNPNDRHNALGLANYSKKLEIDSHLQSGNKNRSSGIDIETLGRIGHEPINSPSYNDIMRKGMQRLQFDKELDRRAEERSNKYYEKLYSDGLKSAQSEAALAKSRTPTFFTDNNGVKKERLSDKEEARIAKGLSYNTADFKAKDAELRNKYENERLAGFDRTTKTSDVYSYDQYLRRNGYSDHADKRSAINSAKADDEYRTWHNGQASQRERSRQDSLNAVQKFEQRKAITEANRRAAEAKNSSYQQAMNRSSNYQKYVNSDAFKRDAFNGLSRTMSSKQTRDIFNTLDNRLRQQTPIGNRRINSVSSSSMRYRQAATRVTSAARSKVSSYATKARTNAGKMFTNYMTKMAEASKTIDADLWSF